MPADVIEQTDTDETAEDQAQTEETEQHADDEQQTYPAKVVKDLRKEAATYRERARTAEGKLDAALRELFTARTAALGLLADPDDLPFDAELLADPGKHAEAVNGLISRKPHLKTRKVSGAIGQGQYGEKSAPQDFSSLLR